MLDVDPGWRMHQVSDGQRRRVQLLLDLERTLRVILLDEVTAELDVLARADLLGFLREESAAGVTVLYASHVLDGLEEIKVCVGYELDGKRIERFPFTMGAQARLKPIWETFEGWSESTQGARSFAELPATCIKYVRRIEELVGCPVALLSTSPQREDTILMTDPFRD